jgi:molecular chaperone DnaJ
VRPHELFERDGLDLLCSMPVPMTTAALGGEIDAPCLLGGENCSGEKKIKIKIPEGAQTGRTVRLRGRGMPSLRSRERGDLVVELFIETPTRLSAKQKALLRELEACCSEQHNPRSTGFLKKARRFWDEVTGSEAQA